MHPFILLERCGSISGFPIGFGTTRSLNFVKGKLPFSLSPYAFIQNQIANFQHKYICFKNFINDISVPNIKIRDKDT